MIYRADDSFVTRVTLDGKDITQSCLFADDEIGYVAVYEVDDQSRIIADEQGRPISHGKIGKVIVES